MRRPRRLPRLPLAALPLVAVLAALPAWARPQDPAGEPSPALEAEQPSGEAPPEPAPAGPRINAVELRSDVSLGDRRELRSLITLEPGQPLTERALRRTLRNLQATERVAEAEVYTRPLADGSVEVVLAVWGNVLVEAVRLVPVDSGGFCLDEQRLRTVLEQQPQEPLLESRVLRGLYAIEELLEKSGYFGAEVRLAVTTDDARKRAAIDYRITCGPRAVIGLVGFDGDLGPYTPDELAAQLAAPSGAGYDAATVRDDQERLQRWLVAKSYRLARVGRPVETHELDGRRVDLVYPIQVGPRVELEVRGASLDDLRKRELLPLLNQDGYDAALLQQSAQLIRRYYQRRGHYRVRVDAREERGPDAKSPDPTNGGEGLRVTLEITPGDVYRLTAMHFEGNQAFGEAQLESLMATLPRRPLRPGSGRLVDDTLQSDLDNIRSFYALRGFSEVQVGPEAVHIDGHNLRLEIPIEEGPQRQVAAFQVEGLRHLPIGPWINDLALGEGKPFHPRHLEDTIKDLRSRYQQLGYEGVQISPHLNWISSTLVEIELRVLEGPQTAVDRILIRGNHKTRDSLIRRVVDLSPGDPVSRTHLLEIERRLSQLGIFSRVDVELAAGGLGNEARDVVVRVEEARPFRLTYGFGYDSDDGLRGLLGVTHANLRGRALRLQLDTRISQRDQRFRLLLGQPFLGHWRLPVTYSLSRFDEDRESFEQRSLGLRVEALKDFEQNRLGLVYDYRTISLRNVDLPLNEIEREDREIQISSFIPALLFDRRDDPIDPTRGYSALAQLQYAFPALSADAHFLKLFLQETSYVNLGRFGVIASSFRLGGIEPLQGAGVTDLPSNAENPVPIGERFFAGGRTSHRAYGRDQLGILGRTLIPTPGSDRLIPVGGNGLALANLEYRFPIAGALGGSAFFDAGNIWPDWRDLDPRELKYGVGLGVRYSSPIGPVRLEVGWKLEREPGESGAEVFLSLGNPF